MNRIVLTLGLTLIFVLSFMAEVQAQHKDGRSGPPGSETKPAPSQGRRIGGSDIRRDGRPQGQTAGQGLPPRPSGRTSALGTRTERPAARQTPPSRATITTSTGEVEPGKVPTIEAESGEYVSNGKTLKYTAVKNTDETYLVTADIVGCTEGCKISTTVTADNLTEFKEQMAAALDAALANPEVAKSEEEKRKEEERARKAEEKRLREENRLQTRIETAQQRVDDCEVKEFDEATGKVTQWGREDQADRISCYTERIDGLLRSKKPEIRQKGLDLLQLMRDEYSELGEYDPEGTVNERDEDKRAAFEDMFKELERNPYGKTAILGFKAEENFQKYDALVQTYKTEMNSIQNMISNGQTAQAAAALQRLKRAAPQVERADQIARQSIQNYQAASDRIASQGEMVMNQNPKHAEMFTLLEKPNDFRQRLSNLELKNFQNRTTALRNRKGTSSRTGGVFSDDSEVDDDLIGGGRATANGYNRGEDYPSYRGAGLGLPILNRNRIDLGSPNGNLLGTGLVGAQSGTNQINPNLGLNNNLFNNGINNNGLNFNNGLNNFANNNNFNMNQNMGLPASSIRRGGETQF